MTHVVRKRVFPNFLGDHAALGSIFLRVAGLGSRLMLTLYLARYLGFEAIATYGFVVGSSAAMIALSGLGLDYRMGRLCVSVDAATATGRIRDRSILRLMIGIGLLAVGEFVLWHWGLADRTTYIIAIFIVLLEPVCSDLHKALIYRFKPLFGNLILFLRSAAWIPVVVIAGVFLPASRTLEFVLAGWAIGLFVSIAVVLYLATRKPVVRHALVAKIDWSWIRQSAISSPAVYASELGYAGMIYGDRYIVAILLGERAAGIFTFLWTITNAIVQIVQAGVFNQIGPQLSRSWQSGDRDEWARSLAGALRSAVILSATCGALVFIAIATLLPLFGLPQNVQHLCLVILMCLAIVIRMRAEVFHAALYSSEHDRQWIFANLIGLFAAPPIALIFIQCFGLIGTGLQMVATALLMLILRRRIMIRLGLLRH